MSSASNATSGSLLSEFGNRSTSPANKPTSQSFNGHAPSCIHTYIHAVFFFDSAVLQVDFKSSLEGIHRVLDHPSVIITTHNIKTVMPLPVSEKSLQQGVSPIHNHIQTGDIRRRITRKIQVRTLELAYLPLASTSPWSISDSSRPNTSSSHTYPMGILFFRCSSVSASAKLDTSVLIYPGETVLTRANPVHSTARLLQK